MRLQSEPCAAAETRGEMPRLDNGKQAITNVLAEIVCQGKQHKWTKLQTSLSLTEITMGTCAIVWNHHHAATACQLPRVGSHCIASDIRFCRYGARTGTGASRGCAQIRKVWGRRRGGATSIDFASAQRLPTRQTTSTQHNTTRNTGINILVTMTGSKSNPHRTSRKGRLV